jgi:GDP-4-dehydro-6-deoxy-D-mannose reductase
MACIFITGASSFSAKPLIRLLVEENAHTILGTGRRPFDEPIKGWRYEYGDIRDKESLRGVLKGFSPQWVFHLAGIKSGSLAELYDVNLRGSKNLLEVLQERTAVADGRILFIGSAAEYGLSGRDGAMVTERALLQPVASYAISKVVQSGLGLQYAADFGLPIVLARSFNLLGPGQDVDMVAGSWARQIARIEQELEAPILRVQALGAARDFVDIRDAVRGYRSLVEKGQPGESYNIASGDSTTLQQLLEIFQEFSRVPFDVEASVEAVKARDTDIPVLRGDSAKLRQLAGWQPRIDLKQSVLDMLGEQREIVSREIKIGMP